MSAKKNEMRSFKVRCARTFACYAFVDGIDISDAEKKARKWFAKKDAEIEASYIHETFEVEEG